MNTSFRKKSKKQPITDSRMTIGAIHGDKEKQFTQMRKQLPAREKELQKLEKQLAALNQKEDGDLAKEELSKKWDLQDSIDSLKDTIDNIKNRRDESEYYLNTAHILGSYSGPIQQEKKRKQESSGRKGKQPSTTGDVTSFFNVKKKKTKDSNTSNNDDTSLERITDGKNSDKKEKNLVHVKIVQEEVKEKSKDDVPLKIDSKEVTDRTVSSTKYRVSDFISGNNNSKADMVSEYLSIVDSSYVPKSVTVNSACEDCGSTSLIMEGGHSICQDCGNALPDAGGFENYNPGYKEMQDLDVIPYFAYKRINHLNEWLSQVQASENTTIPDQVIDDIKAEIKKLRIKKLSTLTPEKMREILKKLNYNKYYEHAPHIINRIQLHSKECKDSSKVQSLSISSETEERIRLMFKEIQAPYDKHKPDTRKNFLNYGYVLYKFCELLELDDCLPRFSLLKSREKLYEHDVIWKNICHDLRWEFIPTV